MTPVTTATTKWGLDTGSDVTTLPAAFPPSLVVDAKMSLPIVVVGFFGVTAAVARAGVEALIGGRVVVSAGLVAGAGVVAGTDG